MEGMEYFYELFESMPRGGPGNSESTRRAFQMIKVLPEDPLLLDIGCGHGVHTLELARISGGRVIALDNHQPFLDILMEKAREEGLDDRIVPACMSMLEMDFEEGTFDLIWSEGALYNMGFPEGLRKGRTLLKGGGYMAVSELTILSQDPPDPVMEYLKREYPPVQDVKGNFEIIDAEGFRLTGHFTLDSTAWLDCFYAPMEKELDRLEGKYQENENALAFFSEMRNEIYMYRKYGQFYGYEFFVMQKK